MMDVTYLTMMIPDAMKEEVAQKSSHNMQDAADALEKQGIRVEVLNFHTIKPLDEELLLKSAGKTGCVVTVEEHSVVGGLGSAVCDVLSQKCPSRVMKIGIEDTFGESGPAEELLEKYGLCASCICKKIYQWMK